MDKLTKQSLDSIRKELNTSFAEIEKKYNIKLSMGTIRYTDSSFTTKLTGVLDLAKDPKDLLMPADSNYYVQLLIPKNQTFYNVTPDMYGKSFKTVMGDTYTFVGLKPSRKQYPIIARNSKNQYVAISYATFNDSRFLP